MNNAKVGFRFFAALVGVGMIFILALVIPVILGRWIGHRWGLVFAIVGIAIWLFAGRKWTTSVSMRALRLLGVGLALLVAIFEASHLIQ